MKKNYKECDINDLPMFARDIIEEILRREGGKFTNHPNDWPTKWGIRKLSADRAGYEGPIESLTKDDAAKIWISLFWFGPNLHQLADVSRLIAATVIDTGGPAGIRIGIRHLQKSLTVMNRIDPDTEQRIYGDDLTFDGLLGAKTTTMLVKFLEDRSAQDGERVLASNLNCLQEAHYTEVALSKPEKRDFKFGWSLQRVFKDLMDLASNTDALV